MIGGIIAIARRSVRRLVPAALRPARKLSVAHGITRHVWLPPVPAKLAIGESPAPPNSINWIVPGFREGSGGHLNIFRFIRHLETVGYDCRIVIPPVDGAASPGSMKQRICRNFGDIRGDVYLDLESAPDAYACVATGWGTAYAAQRFMGAKVYFYFVQDYEPWFYPAGSQAALAEATYRMNFVGLTAGDWLAKKLKSEFGMQTHAFGFACDAGLYSPVGRAPRGGDVQRVFFYARAETERRGFELGMLALRSLTRRMPNVRVVLAGMDASRFDIEFPHENLGIMRIDELAAVYRGCDAALVLSMTNASLLPLEIMACGTPVVSNRGPWVEWLLADGDAFLADASVEGLSDALEEVLSNSVLWQALHQRGLKRARTTSWDRECERLASVLHQYGCAADGVRT